MKIRPELSGLHIFDRNSGMHILLDEINCPPETVVCTPRTFSIALTNACDLDCDFCYAPKYKAQWDFHELCDFCKTIDDLGTLEVTFGGGEPLLYPHLVKLCEWISINTNLGVSITTHGHLLDESIASGLVGSIQSLRFSIESIEPLYSKYRKRPLDELIARINLVRGKIHTGINLLIFPRKTQSAKEVLDLAVSLKVDDVLLIPLHNNGVPTLDEADRNAIGKLITEYSSNLQINVSGIFETHFSTRTLDTSIQREFEFAHATANQTLQQHSFGGVNVGVVDNCIIEKQLRQIYEAQLNREA